MNTRLRWGILGTGNIAHQFAEGVVGSRRGVLAAVGSRSASTAQQFAAEFNIPNRHESYDALVADDTVDVVYVSLPNSMHHAWTIKALDAGKHVLCEKPFAVNLGEAQEMFDTARRRGRVLIEAFMYQSHPQTRAVMETIQSGAIGAVRLVRTSFCFRTTKIAGNVRYNVEMAGGALMDIGCYCTSLSRLVAGQEPDVIQCTARLHESGVDELTSGFLRFPNGVQASFVCAMCVQTDNAAIICGEDGYITVPVPWKPPVKGTAFHVDGMTPPRQDKTASPRPQRRTMTVDADRPLFALEADDFAAAVFDGAAPAVTEQDTLGNMRVLDELRRQAGLSF